MMNATWQLVLLGVAAYLLGSVPFGFLVAKAKGVDIRSKGSGNVGATNIGRVLGRKWGLFVLLLDAGKGLASTAAAAELIRRNPAAAWARSTALQDVVWLGAGVACILGSIFPLYLRFRGGKGVAASLGVILGIYPYLTWPGILALVIWALVVKLTGYVSLGSIIAVTILPIAFAAMGPLAGWSLSDHFPLLVLCILLACLILVRHRDNIGRLLSGTENKTGRKPAA